MDTLWLSGIGNGSIFGTLYKTMATTKIKVNSNGSLRIEGDFEIVDKTSIWNRYLPKLIPRNLLLKHGAALLGVEQSN